MQLTTTTHTVDAGSFARAASNASLFASKDRMRPVLTSVCLSASSGEMKVETTDSYVCFRELVDCAGDDLAPVLLPAADLAPIVKAAKAFAGGKVEITVADREVTFAVHSSSFALRTFDGDWPRTDVFFDSFTAGETGRIGLGSSTIARLAKVAPSDKPTKANHGEPMVFEFQTELKCVKVTWPGNSAMSAVVMPVRIP